MAEKHVKTRIVHKHDSETNWAKASGFIPLKGEIIVYDVDETHAYERFKIGDGVKQADGTMVGTKVNDLPFANQHIDGSLVFNEGEASGVYSIAGGSTDKSVLDALLGSLASTSVNVEKSKALGAGSLALGSGTVANSTGSNAIGVWNTSGCKGYYWKELTNKAGATSSTFALSKNQPALIGSWTSVAADECDWQIGDTICIIDEAHFPMCATITGKSTAQVGSILSGGKKTTVTITTTKLPFDGEASLLLTTPQNKSICAFYQKTEVDIAGSLTNKRWYPRGGAIDFGWAATSLGVENLNTGSAGLATGWNNWQASSFGIVAGRENISGYGNITSGYLNTNLGDNGLMVGKENKAELKSLTNIIGGRSNIARKGSDGAIIGGSTNENYTYNSLIVGARNKATGTDKGDHIIGGADNEVSNVWNSLVVGSGNYLQSSNAIVCGQYSSDGYGTLRLVVGGGSKNEDTGAITRRNVFTVSNEGAAWASNYISTAGYLWADNYVRGSYLKAGNTEIYGNDSSSLKSGCDNFVYPSSYASFITGSRNTHGGGGQHLIAGADNSVESGWNNLVVGEHNYTTGSNAIICGKYNAELTGARIIVGGGDSDSNRKNVFTVTGTGVVTAVGDINTDAKVTANTVNAASIVANNLIKSENKICLEYVTTVNSEEYRNTVLDMYTVDLDHSPEGGAVLAMGDSIKLESKHSTLAIGRPVSSSKLHQATGQYSAAFGEACNASGYGSLVAGTNCVTGPNLDGRAGPDNTNYGFGNDTSAGTTRQTGKHAVAIGGATHAKGDYSFAGGNRSQALKIGSFAFGNRARANGDYSTVFGLGTNSNTAYQTVVGKYNVYNDYDLFVVGNGTDSTNRSNAFTVTSESINMSEPVYMYDVEVDGDAHFTKNVKIDGNLEMDDTLNSTAGIKFDRETMLNRAGVKFLNRQLKTKPPVYGKWKLPLSYMSIEGYYDDIDKFEVNFKYNDVHYTGIAGNDDDYYFYDENGNTVHANSYYRDAYEEGYIFACDAGEWYPIIDFETVQYPDSRFTHLLEQYGTRVDTDDLDGLKSIVRGTNNAVPADCKNSLIIGANNEFTSGIANIIGGEQNKQINASRSLIIGAEQKAVGGTNHIVAGKGNKVTSGVYNSLVVGARNTANMTYGSAGDHLVGGADNTVDGYNNIVGGCYNSTTCDANNCLVIGTNNMAVTNNQLITGNHANVTSDTLFAVGSGGDTIGPRNAFEVKKNWRGENGTDNIDFSVSVNPANLSISRYNYNSQLTNPSTMFKITDGEDVTCNTFDVFEVFSFGDDIYSKGIKIGNTELAEEKLQKLLKLLDHVEIDEVNDIVSLI